MNEAAPPGDGSTVHGPLWRGPPAVSGTVPRAGGAGQWKDILLSQCHNAVAMLSREVVAGGDTPVLTQQDMALAQTPQTPQPQVP